MTAKRRLLRIAVLHLLAVTLAACGGGGGGGGGGGQSSALPPDTTPDSFTFTAINGADEGSLVESNTVTVTGFSAPAPIAISRGEYSVNGGPYTSASGTISPGQTVKIRVAAAITEDTYVAASLRIGGLERTFVVKSADRTPDDFAFTSVERAAFGATVESEPVAITGFDSSTSIAVTGGEYSIAGAPFTSSAGTILPNDTVAVRVTAAATPDTAAEATVEIGGVSGTFSAKTIDTIPDDFAFVPADDVSRGIFVLSNAVTITGIDVPTPISIAGGEYSIDGNAVTAATGEIEAGQTVRLRVRSSSTPGGVVDVVLTVGEVTAAWKVTSSTDVTPPAGSFVFPLPVSRTSANEITLRGTASDTESAILSVRVNGIAAVSDDDFATWTATLPLVPGPNEFVLAVSDTKLNADDSAAQVAVKREPLFGNVSGLSYDNANERLIVADPDAGALVTVHAATGFRLVLSNPLVPDTGEPFSWIHDVAVDAARNRALVVAPNAVVGVDLETGARSLVAGSLSVPGSLLAIAVDAAGGRAFVLDGAGPRILAIDLVGGFVTVLSDPTTPDDQNLFTTPNDIEVDAANNRLLVYDSADAAIYAVDLTTGARSILSSNTVPNTDNPFVGLGALALDAANDRVLVTQAIDDSVLVVDLTSGARTVWSSPTIPDAVSPFSGPLEIAVDPDDGRAFVFDAETRDIQTVDLSSGARAVLSSQEPTSAGPRIPTPQGVAHDPASGRLLIANGSPPAVVTLDLATSVRTTLSDNSTPNVFNPFSMLFGIELDAANDFVYVSDGAAVVYKVSRGTGERAVLSSNGFPNGLNAFGEPRGLAIDSQGNRLLAADFDLPGVVAVDLTSGERSIVSTTGAPAGTPDFVFPNDLVLDAANDRVVVAGFGAALGVSLSTGGRSVFSSPNVPQADNRLLSPRSLAWDAPRNRFIASDSGTGAGFRIVAVDAATGAAEELSPRPGTVIVNRLPQADGIAVDAEAEIAFVTDRTLGVVAAVDLRTGERVFLTR